MNTLTLFAVVAAWFCLGYVIYGRYLAKRLIGEQADTPTPARRLEDGVDYCPAKVSFLWGHHFSSIAGAGPIIGPILAVSYFGWGPAVLWIALGSLFIGAVHDYLALMLSVRHGGKGMAEVAAVVMGQRTRLLFGVLLWVTLVFIVTVFAIGGAQALINDPRLCLPTFGVCLVAMAMSLAVYRFRLPALPVTLIAVLLTFGLIAAGFHYPLVLPAAWSLQTKLGVMLTLLFGYCFLASLLPVWVLLQPRDFLSSVLLGLGLVLGVGALMIVPAPFNAPFYQADASRPLWPMLFITLACGAISGYHCIVSSGTTAKQLASERHGRPVAFGGMLMEGLLALLVVIMVGAGLKWGMAPAGSNPMVFFGDSLQKGWIVAFANGYGRIVGQAGFPWLTGAFSALLGATMVKTFVMTSLDTSTRLGRLIFVETFFPRVPWLNNRAVATLALLLPSYWLAMSNNWQTLWKMFGASNQLIAALTLMVAGTWLVTRGRPSLPAMLPALFMAITTLTALLWQAFKPGGFFAPQGGNLLLGGVALLLCALAVSVAVDAVTTILCSDGKKKSETNAVVPVSSSMN
ncbi:MAG: carbon starvation protein A [Pedobacter sp.]